MSEIQKNYRCKSESKLFIKLGYTPDLARMEADRVIDQSELLAESFTK